jgi:glutamine synthetase
MPKPLPDAPGSGVHVNLSLTKNGRNIFKNISEGHSNIAESFIAGILAKTSEMTLFLNPLANSYERLGKFEAPKYVSWSHQNRSQLVRIPAAAGENVRMELRSPDPSLNPYLAFSLIIAAGLDGIESNMTLPPAVDADLYTADSGVTQSLERLPDSLDAAIALAEDSKFVKSVIGEELLAKYIGIKKTEVSDFAAAKDKAEFYQERYFNVI